MAILAEAPEGSAVLDLGAARAARAEARAAAGKGNSFLKLTAGFVELRPEFPLSAAALFKAEDIRGGLAEILVDPADADVLLADGLTVGDVEALTKFIQGVTLGE